MRVRDRVCKAPMPTPERTVVSTNDMNTPPPPPPPLSSSSSLRRVCAELLGDFGGSPAAELLAIEAEAVHQREARLAVLEAELEEEQQRLLDDTRVKVERIQAGARALQAREAEAERRERELRQREAEAALEREALTAWAATLRRQAREAAAAKRERPSAAETREAARRVKEREEALWETAAKAVPQGSVELRTITDLLRQLHVELCAMAPSVEKT